MTTTPKSPATPTRISPSERRALGALAVAAVAALALISYPVASGLFLGTVLAFSLQPVYQRFARRPERGPLVALALTLLSGVAIAGAATALAYFIVARGLVAANALARQLEPGAPLRTTLNRLDAATHTPLLGSLNVAERARESASNAASKLASWAAALAGLTFGALLVVFFTLMTAFFVLRHWSRIAVRLERTLPLAPAHTRVVLAEFQKVGKEVFVGTLLTGVIQGGVAAVGFAVAGVPEPALLGALTAACSLVPAVGTLLVWVPVGVVLIVVGRPVAGVFQLLWGALVVGVVCDYVVRPRLLRGGGGSVPKLLTFISLFGGVEVFGLLGLVIGPVIASVAVAVLRTYDREIEARRGADGSDDGSGTTPSGSGRDEARPPP